MKRILTLSFVSFFVLSVLSGCTSYTLDRAEIEIKKTHPQQPPHQPYPNMNKKEEHEEDDNEGPGNSDFGHSHMKPEIKKKFEENKEKNEDKFENKKENKKNKKERDNEEN